MSNAPEYEPNRRLFGIGSAIVVVLVIGFLLSLLVPAIQEARISRRASCIGELKIHGICMWNYHDIKRSFPPAYLADVNGQPAQSWRLLLLPFEELGRFMSSTILTNRGTARTTAPGSRLAHRDVRNLSNVPLWQRQRL